MKKSLVALAALAVVGMASAQSSVTLYGTLDAGLSYFNKVGNIAPAGAAVNMQGGTMFVDSALASSVWGLRGSEDLGGGLRADFKLESDVQMNNGGLSQVGLFRRAAQVGLSSGIGAISFGVTMNPLIATNAALMPLSGNSVATSIAIAMGYSDFFTRNSVTYTTPNLSGFVGSVQSGFGNKLNGGSDGSMTALSLAYVNGPLALRVAAQKRDQNGTVASANYASGPNTGYQVAPGQTGYATPAVDPMVTNGVGFNKETLIAGASYKIGAFTLAAAYLDNKYSTGVDGALGTLKLEKKGAQVGLGYQASPALLVGGSYADVEGSKLTNLQARYSLSKRTTVYANVGVADNATAKANSVNFAPTFMNTGNQPAVPVVSVGVTGVAGQNETSIGFGVIHNF
jgi:predicted porin